jgi:hypothetical protein
MHENSEFETSDRAHFNKLRYTHTCIQPEYGHRKLKGG